MPEQQGPGSASGQRSDAMNEFFLRTGKERVLNDGEDLYEVGSTPQEVFLLVNGTIAVFDARGGSPSPIGSKAPGDLVAEVAALLEVPRAVTARATGPATVLAIRSDAFRDAVRNDPALGYEVITRLARTVLASTRRDK